MLLVCVNVLLSSVFKFSSHLSPETHSQVSSIIDKALDLAGGLAAIDLD